MPLDKYLIVYRTPNCTPVSPGVNVLTASVVIAPLNTQRMGFFIFNNSTNSVYVTLGATSVAATCTMLIPTYATWSYDFPICYTGIISAIRNAGTGVCTVHELLSS